MRKLYKTLYSKYKHVETVYILIYNSLKYNVKFIKRFSPICNTTEIYVFTFYALFNNNKYIKKQG